jgi:hypothetical protein
MLFYFDSLMLKNPSWEASIRIHLLGERITK